MSAGPRPRWSVVAPQGTRLELAGSSGVDAWRALAGTAALARGYGYDTVWLEDRTDTLPRREPEPVTECWTALGALAATVPDIGLGLLSAAPPHRNALLLAKQAAGADIISGGRFTLGLPTAPQLPEHVAAGTARPGAGTRPAVAETIEALRSLWSGTRTTVDGETLTLAGAHAVPVPVQPRLPLVIRADAAHPAAAGLLPEAAVRDCAAVQWQGDPSEVACAIAEFGLRREKLGLDPARTRHALLAECRVFGDQVSRDRWLSTPHVVAFWSHHPDLLARRSLYGTVEQNLERAGRYADAGVTEFVLWFRDYPQTGSLRRVAEEIAPRMPALAHGTHTGEA
ncbi:LLM class flavin-dependent oxidoreductase [Streptomyces pacificus]|uniref:LLM class flavin-dependent oxidoreductase n=1 Tax=Streptomyces pacificus TaxID=2705029 RepID=A0A6A0B388_9ACTN|nr:LLM class flavin-dependent oxidoreductase [Streptomyces pacificus]GFH38257.1 LLM class flavin-dependent oxidoreductase [Streptomyces pacificus]